MSGFPSVGERFGDYRIDSELGRGGMGVVFLATQLSLNRPVALKVLDPRLAGDADFTQRFEREAAILARMSSPHIIQVYEHGRVDNCLFLATQYVTGGDLSDRVSLQGPLPVPLALELTAQILAALADAHAAGVIHRDVKPSNILLTTSANRIFAYLCDFGIAQSSDAQLTRTGTVAGSLAFMAPERHEGRPATAQSDIYSAGCVLWASITGQNPFTGTEIQMAMGHLSGAVPRLPGDDPLTSNLNRVLARSLAKNPAGRYSTASSFLDDVRALAEQRPIISSQSEADDRTRLRPKIEQWAQTTLRPVLPPPVLPMTASHGTAAGGSTGVKRRRAWTLPVIGIGALTLITIVMVAVIVLPNLRSQSAAANAASSPTVRPASPASAKSATASASPATTGETGTVLVEESFSSGGLPYGWFAVLGKWEAAGGRLEVKAGNERARIAFGPARPENYRIEFLVRFVKVANASRWINIGLDQHIAEDWGSVLGIRSDTTSDNGLELAQAPGPGSPYTIYPAGPAPAALGVGQDHWVSIEVHGSNLTAAIDGQTVIQAANLAHNGGGFGLVVNNSVVQFDNFKIVQLNE